jgi:hypothetical protein
MKYTYRTFQYGQRGAVAVVFQDGIQIAETRMIQSFLVPDYRVADRAAARSAARQIIAERKQLDDYRAGKIDAQGRRIAR